MSDTAVGSQTQTAVWREGVFWGVFGLAVLLYLPRVTLLTVRGEESRRAVIAREMMQTGDWITPRVQGEVRLSRPPLQNWLIAMAASATGEFGPLAIRLPGVVATIGTALLIYGVARSELNRTVAALAACIYLSFIQVLELGRTGETEPIFTCLVAASQLLWWRGWYHQRLYAMWGWSALLAGMATLTKGLQAPIYYFIPAYAFLFWKRELHRLLHPAHWVGWGIYIMVVGAWQVPFTFQQGWYASLMIYFWNILIRLPGEQHAHPWLHWLSYPLQVFLIAMLPWSICWLLLGWRDVRQQFFRSSLIQFCVVSLVLCFVPVWLPAESRPRYFMPLFPCAAMTLAQLLLVSERLGMSRLVGWFIRLRGMLGLGLALIIMGGCVAYWRGSASVAIELWIWAASGLACLVVLRGVPCQTWSQICWQTALTLTVCVGVGYTTLGLGVLHRRSNPLPAQVAQFKAQLPENVPFGSLGEAHHAFLYYFGQSIPRWTLEDLRHHARERAIYFCCECPGDNQPDIPLAWEEVTRISVDRHYRHPPQVCMVIGRIIPQHARHEETGLRSR
ncbi:MAG: hypothetical protein KatS3mg113_0714 [Planctomycetaceae bacterium]|nr:MAG: hypothetical protein KatS3mg113_0714 [Planctomycetaceae bacterium]